MAIHRLPLAIVAFGACTLCFPRNSAAQSVVSYAYATTGTNLNSCRGFTSIHHATWSRADSRKDSLNATYPTVADLDPASPAGVAGLVNGDSIVTVNRMSTLGASLPELSLWNLESGDFNRMQVKRAGKLTELTFHMGVWASGADPSAPRVCRPQPK